MDVEQHDVRNQLGDRRYGRRDVVRLAHDVDPVAELSPHSRPEQPVVVDDHHPDGGHALAIADVISSCTSVPAPGDVRTNA